MKTTILILLVAFSCMLSGNSISNYSLQQNPLCYYTLNTSYINSGCSIGFKNSDWFGSKSDRTWRLQEIVYQSDYSSTDSLYTVSRYCMYYNNNLPSRIDSIRVYNWNSSNGTVSISYTNRFTYNPTGEYITEIITYNYEINQENFKVVCSYDEQNRLIKSDSFIYDDSLNVYINTSRKVHIYGVNCLEQTLFSSYSTQFSTPSYSKKIYTHDSQGRIVSIDEANSSDSLTWVPWRSRQITYHSNDTSTGEQYVDYFSHYAFLQMLWNEDIFGMVSEVFSDTYWNGITWDINSRDMYNYTTDNRLAEVVNQINMGGWTNVMRNAYLYNSNDNLFQKIRQSWDYLNNAWLAPSDVATYYWEQFSANEDNVVTPVTMRLNIYPNPFSNNLNVTFQSKSNAPVETSIYNLKGQLIKSLGKSKTSSLIWDGKDKNGMSISNGIYLIKAKQDGKTVTSKIVRMR